MKKINLNAWCDYPDVDVPFAECGPLSGLTLAVKDIFEVAGYPNGWGHPARLAEAQAASVSQPIVQQMLDAGIKCIGKSQCEELCYSLMGNNMHYGAPYNSAAPSRLTGGSSSGSASLIAAGAVDVATASDTAGSVRAPASFCGLIGLRTTHERMSLAHSMALAPSFDCFGWFAKDIATYQLVAETVMEPDVDQTPLKHLIVVDSFKEKLLGPQEAEVYLKCLGQIETHFSTCRRHNQLPFSFDEAVQTFVTCQSYEVWATLGEWITTRAPKFGPGIDDRLNLAKSITFEQFQAGEVQRDKITSALSDLVGSDAVLVLPTVPGCAPLKAEGQDALHIYRQQMIGLLCLASLSGLPQISLPLGQVHGAPFGLSLLGPKGSDRRLIELAAKIMV